MRHHFKVSRVCSSDNYELSRRLHKEQVIKDHINNIDIIKEITDNIIIKKKTYCKFNGVLIPISEEEIRLHPTLTIVYI